jgi:hypothetical protein
MITRSALKILFVQLYLLISLSATGQVVTTEPTLPFDNQPVTVYFDATQGDQGLMNFAGDVYAHTGVLTDKSASNNDWKYVRAEWTENIPECKLTRISTNLYSLDISPSIREFYGVPASEKILKMCFVFRNSDGTKTGRDDGGKDIFTDVFEEGLNVSFIKPSAYFSLLENGESVPVEISATNSDSVSLFLDNNLIASDTGTILIDTIQFTGSETHIAVARAYKDNKSTSDTAYFLIKAPVQTEPLPAGMQDGINYIDDNTATLVLYAPRKTDVYLLGDMNNWTPDNNYQLKKDGDRFWITLNGLTKGKEYGYQYMVDDSLLIGDPYADKVLDPWNDSYISAETYPNLKPYPAGKTQGIVTVFQTGQQEYIWKNKDFIPPANEDLVIYELLIRDFTEQHTYQSLIDTIGYLHRLGINAIELMPINEFEGNESWGYNPDYYFAPDKYYGPKNDLKAFIDTCHGRGIAVIQDMVLNHSYGLSPLVQLYFDPSAGDNGQPKDNPWYNATSPNTSYSWGYDFNHESPQTKKFVDRVNRYWLSNYHVDGFRFDFTKGFTNKPGDGWAYDASRISILERMYDSIVAFNPDAKVILEHFTANTEEIALSDHGMMLWGNLNCAYSQASMGYNSGPCGTWDFSSVSWEDRNWTKPYLVGYMESHDEERVMYKDISYGNASGGYNIKNLNTALTRQELTGAFLFLVPGPKMIWQFGELGYDYTIDFNGRVGNKPIEWGYYNDWHRRHLYDTWAALIKLRRNEPAFKSADYSVDASGAVKTITINSDEMDVRVVGNFDVLPASATLSFSSTGDWYDYFSGDTLRLTGTDTTVLLDPGEYHIYTNKKIETPVLATDVKEIPVQKSNYVQAYPNPFDNFLDFTFNLQQEEVLNFRLYDAQGRLIEDSGIQKMFPGSQTHRLNLQENEALHNGIYFYSITGKSFHAYGKLIHK